MYSLVENTTSLALLPAYHPNRSHHENASIDVTRKGCFNDFDTIACVRNGVMSLFVVITGLLCLAKIIKLHLSHHPTLHQYIIFYCAALECTVCAVHWILGFYAQFDFVTQYLKLIQFLVVCHFYWTLATRVLRKEILTKWLLAPIVVMALIYFTVVSAFGIITVKSSWVECFQPQWLMLSSAEFVLVQLFFVAGFYITRRLNEISTLESVRRAQKRDLWSIIMIFELSALMSMVYDATVQSLGDEETGCSAIFLHMQEIYSPVFGAFMVIKYLLPIWAMLCVFHPIEGTYPDQDDLIPGLSEEGTYTSVFSPAISQVYKPLYHPGGGESQDEISPTLPSSWSGSPHQRPPPLAPIHEESSGSHTSSTHSQSERCTGITIAKTYGTSQGASA